MRCAPIFGFTLLLTVLLCPRGLAAPDPSALHFCRTLQTGRDDLPRVNRWTFMRDLFKLAVAPGRLVGLKNIAIETPPDRRLRDPSINAPSPRRHLIFSFTPPEFSYRSINLETLRSEFFAESAELRALSGTALFLLHTPTPEDCALEIGRLGFDPARFLRLLEGQARFRILEQISESALAERSIHRALRRSRIAWEVIPVSDLNEVHRHLSSPDVEDVILIGHGMSDGKLLDSRSNTYPISFFGRLSPRLRSLSIFSCHSEDVGSFYQLEKSFLNSESYRRLRAVYLSPGSRLGGGEERVPIRAFPRFLRRLETSLAGLELREAQRPGPQQPSTSAPVCELDVSGLQMVEGTFGFVLNGHFIGSIHEDEAGAVFSWPCSLLRKGLNIVEMKSLGALTPARAFDLDFTLMPQGPIAPHDLRLQHFFRANGSHQGSKLEFLTDPP